MRVKVHGSDGVAIRPMVAMRPMVNARFRTRLRVRWLMVTGYLVGLALSWFAGESFRQGQWSALAVLVFAVTFIGCLLSIGRSR